MLKEEKMSVEVRCSECEKLLIVEDYGVVVACPHCETHLEIPAELAPQAEQPQAATDDAVNVAATDAPTDASASAVGAAFLQPASDAGLSGIPNFEGADAKAGDSAVNAAFLQPASDVGLSGIPNFEATAAPEPPPSDEKDGVAEQVKTSTADAVPNFMQPLSEIGGIPDFAGAPAESPEAASVEVTTDDADDSGSETPSESIDLDVDEVGDAETAMSLPRVAPSEDKEKETGEPAPAASAATAVTEQAATAVPVKPATDTPPAKSVDVPSPSYRRGSTAVISKPVYKLWISYTVFATLALGLLVYRMLMSRPHQLESLPDIKPRMDQQGRVVQEIVPIYANVAKGHTLQLGVTRRFGNIEVTPVKVTRGDLQFVHYNAESEYRREPVRGVWKLWLTFKNVSDDQVVDPVDADLVFLRGPTKDDPDRFQANQFLAPATKRTKDNVVLLYDHVVDGNYDLKGQDLGKKLQPGEEFTTFLPSEPTGLEQLTKNILWRVQFRKGYSPENYGVTTLIDVEFSADDVKSEANG